MISANRLVGNVTRLGVHLEDEHAQRPPVALLGIPGMRWGLQGRGGVGVEWSGVEWSGVGLGWSGGGVGWRGGWYVSDGFERVASRT